jgi:predicted restriction endonuclease
MKQTHEEKLAKRREYYQANKERLCAVRREHYQANTEEISAYYKEYRIVHSDEIRIYNQKYHKENKERLNAYSAEYHIKHREEVALKKKIYEKEHRKEANANRRALTLKWRKEVLAHYGGKCVCCGETTFEFLAMDHIHGGGNKHRKQLKHNDMCRWIMVNDYPDNFQILCHNCNLAKGYYGQCPHERMRDEGI